jgi:DNA replication protein DnaC
LPAPGRRRLAGEGHAALYLRLPRLLQGIAPSKGDGSYNKLVDRIGKTDVLVLDDGGLATLLPEQRRDLLEILEDRHGSRSTIVTRQLPLDPWHASIGDATLADAIYGPAGPQRLPTQFDRGIATKKTRQFDDDKRDRVKRISRAVPL